MTRTLKSVLILFSKYVFFVSLHIYFQIFVSKVSTEIKGFNLEMGDKSYKIILIGFPFYKWNNILFSSVFRPLFMWNTRTYPNSIPLRYRHGFISLNAVVVKDL